MTLESILRLMDGCDRVYVDGECFVQAMELSADDVDNLALHVRRSHVICLQIKNGCIKVCVELNYDEEDKDD